MNLRAVSAIARKDIVDAIRNRYLLGALLTPLFVAVLLRLLLPGLNGPGALTIVAHDPGGSRMIAELRASPRIKLLPAGSADAVAAEVEKNNAVGGLALPVNFDADVDGEKQPEITIYVNNKSNLIRRAAFRQLLERQILSLRKQPEPARAVWIDVAKEPGEKPPSNLNQMMLPLLLLMTFTMTGALVVPLLLVEEKEKRTLDFLLSSPASLTEIIMGKALTGVLYSLLIAGVLVGLNRQLISNWPLTILTICVGLFFVVALGLLMGSFFKNTMQVNTWAGGFIFLLLAPSFPTPGLPAAVESAIRLIPTHYFVEALRMSLVGNASARLWGHLGVLLAFTVLAFFASTWGLRREFN